MALIWNQKNLGFDLDKFESGENNKLIVLGVSGAGKSTVGKYLAEKYGVKYQSTDEFLEKNFTLYESDPEEFRRQRTVFEKNLLMNTDRMVLEGAGIARMPFEELLKQSAVILGKSSLIGAIDAAKRNVKYKRYSGKFLPEFKVAISVNLRKLEKQVNQFRKERMAVPNTKVEILNTPQVDNNLYEESNS